LKRIAFVIVGILLVLGLILPGCAPEGETNVIKVAVVGPLTDLQGTNMMNGATMAMNELNALNGGAGPSVGGTNYKIQLVGVETHETQEGESGATGTANLAAVIDDVNFCVGGFRTEVVENYRDTAMNADKIFMDVGAATNSLCYSVNDDYSTYKYWFRVGVYNNVFLVTSCLKMTGTVSGVLESYLEGYNAVVKPEFQIGNPATVPLRVAILMESAAWCEGMVAAANYYLPLLGFNVTSTTLVSPTATDINSQLTAIAAEHPHIIFTAFSGSVGAVYSQEKATLGIPAMTVGINVPGQQLVHWANTSGACEGEIMLDTFAYNMSTGTGTTAWFNDYVSQFGIYPVYTAATYDSIKNVVAGMQSIGSTTNSDALVAWLETHPDDSTVASPEVRVYPVASIDLGPVPAEQQAQLGVGEMYALNQTQVESIYDLASYGVNYTMTAWMVTPSGTGGPFEAHDLVYGPGFVTGIGSQWQKLDGGTGAAAKVGIWPKQVAPEATPIGTLQALGLIDQYGNWNFQYDGTMPIIFPIGGMLNIPWDIYGNAY
jgi:branched-chain amino acid transport system substrate-binding protein